MAFGLLNFEVCNLPRRFVLLVACLLSLVALTGCQSGQGHPALDMLKIAFVGAPQPDGNHLDPRFSYLRVTAGKQVAFLALGYVDPHPQGDIEVYYSAKREVLRLQQGRLVGATGTFTEWRQVRMVDVPPWNDVLTQQRAMVWTRVRDVMPGYRFNIEDRLALQAIAPPGQSSMVGANPPNLRWFEERRIAADGDASADGGRPARYALEVSSGSVNVVYGEQCLSADLCVTWQRWKVTR